MDKKELKTKIAEAQHYRQFAQYAEALALLHQITAEYPEAQYYYLLAATYYESGKAEAAWQYLDEALKINPAYKEVYWLKAKIYENQKQYKQAEQMYLKALEIDMDYFEARIGLIDLYCKKQKDGEKTIQQCEFVISRYNSFAFNKEEMKEKFKWLGAVYIELKESYIHCKRYKDAIRLINRYKEVMNFIDDGDEYTLVSEDRHLYKLYYIIGNKEMLEQQQKLLQEHYKFSNTKIIGLQKDAVQGYILETNWDNYHKDDF